MASKTYLPLPTAPFVYDSVSEQIFRNTAQKNFQDVANDITNVGLHTQRDASLSLRKFIFLGSSSSTPSKGMFSTITVGGTTTIASILDEDDFASDSPTALATQQSIKAYVDGVSTSLSLEDLTDVTITSVQDKQSLVWNSTSSEWVNSFLAIDDLSDVTITSVTNNQVLSWDSSTTKWINKDVSVLGVSSVTAGNGLTGGGTGAVTLNVGAGEGISVDTVSVNLDIVGLTLTNNITPVTIDKTIDNLVFYHDDDSTHYRIQFDDVPVTSFNNDAGYLTFAITTAGLGLENNAGQSTTINIDYSGTDNFILSATDALGSQISTSDRIAYVDYDDNVVKYGDVASLPFGDITDVIAGDGISVAQSGGPQPVVSLNIADLTLTNNATPVTIDKTVDNLVFYHDFDSTQYRIQFDDVPVSSFNNDAGYLTFAITTAGLGLENNAGQSSTINIDYSGTDNFILSATDALGSQISTSDRIAYVDFDDNVVKYGDVASLPFGDITDVLAGDGISVAQSGGPQPVVSLNIADLTLTNNVSPNVVIDKTVDNLVFYHDSNSTQYRIQFDDVPVSSFNNDAGYLTFAITTAGAGLENGGGASTTISIDYAGLDNYILSATDLRASAIASTDMIAYVDFDDNNVKYGNVSDLPFLTTAVTQIVNGTNGGISVANATGPTTTLAIDISNLDLVLGSAVDTLDSLPFYDDGVGTKRVLFGNVPLSAFNNDLTLISAVNAGTGIAVTSAGTARTVAIEYGPSNIITSATEISPITVADGDWILVADTSDSLNLRKAQVSNWPYKGTVTSVTAGLGLTSTGSDAITLNVGEGAGILVDANDVSLDFSAGGLSSATAASGDFFAFYDVSAPGMRNSSAGTIPLSIFLDDLGYKNVQGGAGITVTSGPTYNTISVNGASGGSGFFQTAWDNTTTPISTDAMVFGDGGLTGTASTVLFSDVPVGIFQNDGTYALNSALTSHVNNTSNPHSVTKSQVGLGNVENTALSTWAGSTAITTLGTIGNLTVSGNLTVDTNTLFVDATNNRVGIGTASPSALLHINESGSPIVKITREEASITNIESLAVLAFGGDTGSGHVTGAQIVAAAKNTWTGASTGAYLSFWTTEDTTTGHTEKVRIDHNGNVGIGTASPAEKLEVIGSTNLGGTGNNQTKVTRLGAFSIEDGTPGGTRFGSYGFQLFNANTNKTSTARRIALTNALGGNKFAIIRSVDATTDPAIDGANGALSSGTADFVIDNAGNVGIGEVSPPQRLTVRSNVGTNNTATPLIAIESDRNDYYAAIGHYRSGDSTRIGFSFYTTDSTAPTEKMRITPYGQTLVADGSAIYPTYSFLNDANTGMYYVSADTLGFTTGGSERMRIASTGETTFYGPVKPGANNTYALGASGAAWAKVWTYDLDVANNTIFGGNLTVGNTSGDLFIPNGQVLADGGGTVSAPSYSFDNDLNTGIYPAGADTLGFATGGVERVTIASNGNLAVDTDTLFVDSVNNRVGIGTTSPRTALQVGVESSIGGNAPKVAIASAGSSASSTENTFIYFARSGYSAAIVGMDSSGAGATAANNIFVIATETGKGGIDFRTGGTWSSGLQGGTSRLRILDNGNVGIGTASPSAKLHVANGTANNIEINGNYIQSFNRSGTPGYQTLPFYASSYAFNVGNVGIGTASPARLLELKAGEPYLRFNPTSVAGAYIIGAADGALYFTPEASYVQTLTLKSGNVGIGTASPAKKLEIASGDIRLGDGYTISWADDGYRIFRNGTQLRFDTNGTQAMAITSTGNVGIGIALPEERLHVHYGPIRLSSDAGYGQVNLYGLGWSSTTAISGNLRYVSGPPDHHNNWRYINSQGNFAQMGYTYLAYVNGAANFQWRSFPVSTGAGATPSASYTMMTLTTNGTSYNTATLTVAGDVIATV